MTFVFLINRIPARVIDYQTPLRMLSQFHFIPYILNLCPRIFGCICYVHVHSHLRDKLDPRALKCVFLGYPNSQKGYKCFHSPSGKYYVSIDVQFNECESYFSKDVDMVPRRLIVRKNKSCGWKKRGGGFQVRGRNWNWMIHESRSMNAKKQRKDQRNCFNDTISVPFPSSDAPLNDIIMPHMTLLGLIMRFKILHL